jgi:hypothetical protein
MTGARARMVKKSKADGMAAEKSYKALRHAAGTGPQPEHHLRPKKI